MVERQTQQITRPPLFGHRSSPHLLLYGPIKKLSPPLFARDSDVATIFASRSEKAFQTNT